MHPTEIVKYHPEFSEAFASLNIRWLKEYDFTITPADKAQLLDPEPHIIDLGGQILFAIDDSRPIGTIALIPHIDGIKMAKLAVDPSYQNKGIGRQLVEKALQEAKKLDYPSVYLYTNSKKLPAAFSLYQKLGFKVDETHSANPRCETKMTKEL